MVDETFTTIWLSRSSEVRVKVTWDLSLKNDDFQILSPLPFFNQSKTPMVSDTRPKYIKSLSQIFEFPPSYRVTWLQICQKINKNFFHLILMKLGMMLEVDETFTMIWVSRSSEVRVKVRRWPQSPIRTIFTRDSIYAIARICHGNSLCLSICLSVCPSVCHTGGSVKNGWS